MRKAPIVLLVLALVLVYIDVGAWMKLGDSANDEDLSRAQRDGINDRVKVAKTALYVALLFPVLMVVASWRRMVDGFSMGAIVLAVILESIIYYGWVLSPQVEPTRYFYVGTCLPLLLIGSTFALHRMQRQT